MEIITDITKMQLNSETAVAIGKFDGLHLGHRRLLSRILEQKQNGLSACVFTFDPAPAVFFGFGDGKELMTKKEKRLFLEQMGVDILIEFPMNTQTAAIQARRFVAEILVKRMKVKFIAAGGDLSFGAGGKGDTSLLKELGSIHGFEVETIEKIKLDGREISSTYVRERLEEGNMKLVEKLLGRPYTIIGTVVHGNRLGRQLGMPTVNLLPPATKLMPPCGVYYSSVLHNGRRYRAISNVGYKPTVTDKRELGVETYLYDFDSEIYGDEIEVSLHEFKRAEMRFESIEELREQLMRDINDGSNAKG